MLPCEGCGKNVSSTLIALYRTLVSCIEPGCPVETYVKHMSKSQTTRTFCVGIPVLPIYLTCSSGERETRIWVLSDCYSGQSTRGVPGGRVSGWGYQDQELDGNTKTQGLRQVRAAMCVIPTSCVRGCIRVCGMLRKEESLYGSSYASFI